jgi:hypothetical protein
VEFYARVRGRTSATDIQEKITIESIPSLCRFVSSVNPGNHGDMEMNSGWGVHTVCREDIREGVRFTLPGCPNAFAWTITTPGGDEVLMHCVINRDSHDPDFIESIETFVDDWESGLARQFHAD